MYEAEGQARETKSSMFQFSVSALEQEVLKLEDLASRIYGRGSLYGNDQSNKVPVQPDQPPCPFVVINSYPERLREIRDRIQKAVEEIKEGLF